MACERLLSRLACKPEVRAMIPMVATSIVPHLGRLACAYFHSSAHPPDNLGGKSVDRLGMSLILILSLCVEIPIDTRCFVYFPWTRAGKNRNASHTAAQLPRTWASQKPDHCFMSPYWARGRLIATSPCSPVRMISPRKRGKAAQNKDHKRCCESHPHQPAERNPYSFSISTF